jgi:DNA polymerase-1
MDNPKLLGPLEGREVRYVQSIAQLDKMCNYLSSFDTIAFDTETTTAQVYLAPRWDRGTFIQGFSLVGMSFAAESHLGFYVPVGHLLDYTNWMAKPPVQLPRYYVLDRLKFVWDEKKIVAHNLKFDYQVTYRYGYKIKHPYFCTMIAQYVIDSREKFGLKPLTRKLLGREAVEIADLVGKRKATTQYEKDMRYDMSKASVEEVGKYAVADALNCLDLRKIQLYELDEVGRKSVFWNVEMPVLPIMAEMEIEGMMIDQDEVVELDTKLRYAAEDERDNIGEMAVHMDYQDFNPGNPKTVADLYTTKLNVELPNSRGTPRKDGSRPLATDEKALKQVRARHQGNKTVNTFTNHMLAWREIEKMRGTYTTGMQRYISGLDGKIHPDYLQHGARTGRLACAHPNLTNLPRRKDEYNIRALFSVDDPETECLVMADYKALEMRITACLSADSSLVRIILGEMQVGELGNYEGKVSLYTNAPLKNTDPVDIHCYTAMRIAGVTYDLVTDDMRTFYKPVGFGILYGISRFGLSRNLDVTDVEAQSYIDGWLNAFPGVQVFIDECKHYIFTYGYMTTYFGRRRYVDGRGKRADANGKYSSMEDMEQDGVFRALVNSRIQGSAADVMKLAMTRIRVLLDKAGLGYAKEVLQIHDEIVVRCLQKHVKQVADIVLEGMYIVMENKAAGIKVPLEGVAAAKLSLSKSAPDILKGVQLWKAA